MHKTNSPNAAQPRMPTRKIFVRFHANSEIVATVSTRNERHPNKRAKPPAKNSFVEVQTNPIRAARDRIGVKFMPQS